ncbi:hypothetical protein [Microscilla marina]|uniref:Uncharacterized protein n=1 Tax=Microscilla marina ATCC 23134 TaxID=313606 RepID=A1ZW40_MICM2|nr:hypothetical protein [Microscilla marina]EAY25403.1 hypothetical protein M23134_06662 [Microscilla marina ATCC 23134]
MRIQTSSKDNTYFEAFLDEDLKLYELYWLEGSEDMTDQEYVTLLTHQFDIVLKNDHIKDTQSFCQLLDNRFNFFTMSPELQEWQNEYVGKAIFDTLGYYPKTAFIQSEDFITQLSFEQSMEETNETNGMVKYFDNVEDAKLWLFYETED